MAEQKLKGKKVAILAADMFERVRHRRHPTGLPFVARARSSVDRAADF